MGLGCGSKFLQYCLFGFNLIFVIGGLVCLGVGIWLIADKHAMDNMDAAFKEVKLNSPNLVDDYKGMPTAVKNLGIVLAAGGGIILVIAFLGCCGAVKKWRPMLVLYAIFLMVILAIEIAAAIYAAVNRTDFENEIKKGMAATLKGYGGSDSNINAVRQAWDAMMNSSYCCGVDPAYDYNYGFIDSMWLKEIQKCPLQGLANLTNTAVFPPSCHDQTKSGLLGSLQTCSGYQIYTKDQVYTTGCFEKMKAVVENKMSIIIGVGVAVGLVQLIGILFAFCLCCSISQSNNQV